jgi:hypothetical protein
MFYTPKHCCECGEKIDRNEWKLLTSRRFCEICESEFKFYDWLPRLILGVGILLSVIGIGSLLKKTDAPVNISTTPNLAVASNKNQGERNSQVSSNSGVQNPAPNRSTSSEENGQGNKQSTLAAIDRKPATQVTAQTRQNSAAETVYICGAQTKKGTPCSRRVKGGGRCWQHTGQPSMLPPEKLVVSQ